MFFRPAATVIRGANLRTRVFIPVFALACLTGLAYVFSRPPVYVSQARLQVEAPRGQRQEAPRGQRQEADVDRSAYLLTAAQTLTSGSVLEATLEQVRGAYPSVAAAVRSTEA